MSFAWLKRYMPRSLYGRAALILALPVFGLQLIVTLAFIQRHFEDVTTQMTQALAYELRYLVSNVSEASDLAAARQRAVEIGAPLDLDTMLPARDVPTRQIRRFYDLSGNVVLEVLDQEVPSLIATALPDDRTVRVWLETPYGPLRVETERERVSASNPHQLLVVMIVFGVLLTGIAYVYLRNQLRPITRMARAAEEFGKGRTVPYQPSGATEVRAAGRAFVEMRGRIERQTQTRTMMLSGVSHDLRTPLTRLRLGLSMLDEEEAEPLLADVDEMQHLLDTFLDFARADAEDEVEEVDPLDIVRAAVEDAGRSGRDVEMGPVTGEATRLRLRPLALRRSLDNLLGNALRYGTRARVSVRFGERFLRIAVEDDGPGIPPDRREEAMRPFVRLDPSRNQDRGSGVGLGLSIVSDVARAHGGGLLLGESEDLGGLRAELRIAR
ncbi:ATP-binding protein [Histidinibacterium aquaticum]|uniref:histidine kinase n=1 Tax=Histidinibacterium aquaticum TaxID=2613962 RepID=A0A5J5GPF2_9RHOB|nr:ATP-binding protein [Histidinibacterium aquaticum]KAA9009937.1 HAMP domain-containing protein [Histidinibacterium aquaticum]